MVDPQEGEEGEEQERSNDLLANQDRLLGFIKPKHYTILRLG
jgi:hypothetical protein